jgi:circadian clock protein KaiB
MMKYARMAGQEAPAAAADRLVLRLYVTMGTPTSSRAIANIRRLCEQQLEPGRYRLDVFNIADHIERATADEIIASPTLVRVSPLPRRRFIGDLSNSQTISSMLGALAVPSGAAEEQG